MNENPTATPTPAPSRALHGSPYTDTPAGLCYSCRHLAENHGQHCRGTGHMEADGYFLGLRCICDCCDELRP